MDRFSPWRWLGLHLTRHSSRGSVLRGDLLVVSAHCVRGSGRLRVQTRVCARWSSRFESFCFCAGLGVSDSSVLVVSGWLPKHCGWSNSSWYWISSRLTDPGSPSQRHAVHTELVRRFDLRRTKPGGPLITQCAKTVSSIQGDVRQTLTTRISKSREHGQRKDRQAKGR